MAYTPPTKAQLRAEVMGRTGRLLADAGLYAPAVDGSVAVIDYGIARGVQDTGMLLGNPLSVADEELAELSPFAIERVVIWAEHHCLKLIVQGWYRVVQSHMADALSPTIQNSGWLLEQKEGVKGRRDELREILDVPFRDTTDPMSVAHASGHGRGFGADSVLPGWYPGVTPYFEPGFFPFGYRNWGCC